MNHLTSILLVENNLHDQRLIKQTLARNFPDCEIAVAQTGAAALATIAECHYDVLLLDFQLNDMSGMEIFRQMKAHNFSIATVFVTGQGNEQVAVEAMKLGAQNYLVKDIASEYLRMLPTIVSQAYSQWYDQQARKKAEFALRESEETLRTTFISMDDLVFVLNREGICIICYKPLGLQIETIFSTSTTIGFHFSDVFPISLATPLKEIIKLVESSQRVEEFDFPLNTADSCLWFNARVSPRLNLKQHYDGVTVVARNITIRKEEQLQLEKLYTRQSALAMLELAINQPHELQRLLDQVVQIVTDLLPATGGASIILWDADSENYTISASSVTHQSALASKQQIRKEGGATRWIIDHRYPMIVEDVQHDPFTTNQLLIDYGIQAYIGVPLLVDTQVLGVLYGLHVSTRHYSASDVDFLNLLAHRIALAIVKVQLYQELQKKQSILHQQTAELAAQNAELEAFSATVAHDLKNPLATITGYSDLLLGSDGTQLELTQIAAKAIATSSRRMAKIIDELLLLAQIRMKNIEMTPIDMNMVVQESLARLDFIIQQANPSIQLPGNWHEAVAYAPWLEEVWANYISNAIKYGGEPARIELGSTQINDTMVKFWIKDYGPGIPVDKQSNLFTPFTQLGLVRAQGHGLGLSIVQRIINKLGGEVGFESKLGEGSIFYFTLPAA